MTESGLECHNCGRENPAWAQVCRNCGVSLSGAAPYPSGPPPRFPTDRASLVALGSAIATIVVAIFVGLFLVNLDRTTPGTAGNGAQTPSSVPMTPTIVPSVLPSVVPTIAPTATPTPLPGTLTFGTALDETTREVTEPDPDYTRGENFAYSIRMPEAFGVDSILVEVIEVNADGTETLVQEASAQAIGADTPVASFQVSADALINGFGPGSYIMRIYRGEELIAEGPFTLAE